ncbi:hypothetical protein HMN09_01100200 [Mycena chlorophos]|uniref:F-box domain-containing protein n=1 Tax=Mycena chlorophos TaxID=658473 RepID=A0A8H6SEC6_MYCCL|nr:hypothetical protein HMN09_01100200 [Mycena chlorophos]
MADNALPDELISEILSPALRVSDEHFTQTSTATFAKYSESTSAYLVVCKSWLRVATPLLYHVVVLRSKAQATALVSALAKNKDLGRFIKKLRVEGGFGQPMQTILQSAPNLTDLFLSLIIWSPDTTDGLCKGLKSVNPRTLIVHDVTDYGRAPKTKARANLVDTIVKIIPKWSNLTHFHYPLSYRPEATQKIVDALAACQRLEVLYVKDSYEVYLAFKHFSKCPLKAIHVDSTEERYHRYHTSKSSELDALLHFRPRSEKRETVAADIVEPGPSLNPFFLPMQHASPTVQDAIWSCVLRHAMNCEERAATFDKWFGKPASLIGYLLVCKTFLRAGLPHFYESVNLSYGSEDAAVEMLRANPPPQYPIRNFYSAASSIHPGYLNTVILSTSATLVNLFMDIGFEIPDNGDTVSLDALMQLSRLETLHLAGRVSVSVAPESMEKEVNPTALPNLRLLNLERSTKSLVSVFAYFKLPSLRDINVTFDRKPGYGQTTTEEVIQTLLAAHGEKLRQLTLSATVLASFSALDLCPNLTCFSIVPAGDNTLAPSHSVFEAKSAVPSLVQIKIACTSWPYNRTKSARAISSWDDFLDAFDPREVMPNMHELVFQCFRWPTTERDIAKSQWVRWAEQLTKLEIDLVDETGKKWRSRLKVGGRAGQR